MAISLGIYQMGDVQYSQNGTVTNPWMGKLLNPSWLMMSFGDEWLTQCHLSKQTHLMISPSLQVHLAALPSQTAALRGATSTSSTTSSTTSTPRRPAPRCAPRARWRPTKAAGAMGWNSQVVGWLYADICWYIVMICNMSTSSIIKSLSWNLQVVSICWLVMRILFVDEF